MSFLFDVVFEGRMRKDILHPKAVTVLPAGDNAQILLALQNDTMLDVVLSHSQAVNLAYEIASYLEKARAA